MRLESLRLESLRVKFCFFKKISNWQSEEGIEGPPYSKMACGLGGRVMGRGARGPRFDSQ